MLLLVGVVGVVVVGGVAVVVDVGGVVGGAVTAVVVAVVVPPKEFPLKRRGQPHPSSGSTPHVTISTLRFGKK